MIYLFKESGNRRDTINIDQYIRTIDGLPELMAGIPEKVKRRCAVTKRKPGTVLFYQDDPLDAVFILCEGKVKAVNMFSTGKIYLVGDSFSKSFLGEQTVLAGQPAAALTLETVTECVLIRIPRESFIEWVDADHKITRHLLDILSKRLYSVALQRGFRSYHSCGFIVEHFFVKLYESSNGGEIRVNETRTQIAERTGISLRSVEREINRLKIGGYITVRKRKVYIDKSQFNRLSELLERHEYG